MFKNRHIQVKFVKDTEVPTEDTPINVVNHEEIAKTAKDIMKHAAVTGIITIGATVALTTLSQVIILAVEHAFDTKDEED